MKFTLPRPPSVNAAFRNVAGVGRVRTGEYKEWAKVAMQEMVSQRSGQAVPHPPVSVTLTLPDSKGRADPDNFYKCASDLLVHMGVIPDDNDKYVRRITIQVGAPPDRCILEVEPLIVSIPHLGSVA